MGTFARAWMVLGAALWALGGAVACSGSESTPRADDVVEVEGPGADAVITRDAPTADRTGPELDDGSVHADADSDVPEVPSDVAEEWTPTDCPVAVIQIDEGEQVIPQTVLHLHGDQSYSPNGSIMSFQWTVEQPAGSVSYVIPTGTSPNPIFEANVAGKYAFTLEVVDSTGVKSCYPARQEVYVVPDVAIHVELLWDTPADPDPFDEGPATGTDLDLHFAHPFAAGPDRDGDGEPDPWFVLPWDCYWNNPTPDWGVSDPAVDDDPRLDGDSGGWGPESVNLDRPEGKPQMSYVYRVGVHYWAAHGGGPSFATLRIYIYSALVFEVPDVQLQPGDLWEVCTLEWPSTEVKLRLGSDGNYRVHAYPPPGDVKLE